jgi:hypothetical protein
VSAGDIIAAIALAVSFVSVFVATGLYRLARKTEAREGSTTLMAEWWGKDMQELRRYYREEFVPIHAELLKCGPGGTVPSFHELERLWPEDKHRLRAFCFFFDRVGHQGAVGIVDVDYTLAAFQHYVKDLWRRVEPFVEEQRKPENLSRFPRRLRVAGQTSESEG